MVFKKLAKFTQFVQKRQGHALVFCCFMLKFLEGWWGGTEAVIHESLPPSL